MEITKEIVTTLELTPAQVESILRNHFIEKGIKIQSVEFNVRHDPYDEAKLSKIVLKQKETQKQIV